jgi:hypothetical protein
MVRDGIADAAAFENAIQQAQSLHNVAAVDLLAHRQTHKGLFRPETKAAGQV